MSEWPQFAEDEILAVEQVLRSGRVNYWTGTEGRAFEREYAEYCSVPHAVAVANASVGLELALHALGIGPGDQVIVPARTFVATANSAVLRGAIPVFADVDPDSQTMTCDTISAVVSPRTRAIIAVHLAGWPCDMDPILELAADRNLKVIEDCAQAHGARYRGRAVGTLGDVGVFSFCQDKIMTTGGEGGMLVTGDHDVWSRAWSYKDHGKSHDAVYHRSHPTRHGFRWLHESFGTNGRMTEMQAAIGRVQLRKLADWVDTRRRNASLLSRCLAETPGLRVPEPPNDVFHAYYRFSAFVRPEQLANGWTRDRIVDAVNDRGVACFTGSCPEVYLERCYRDGGLAPAGRLPVARQLGESSLSLLVHPTLEEADVLSAANVLADVMLKATGQVHQARHPISLAR